MVNALLYVLDADHGVKVGITVQTIEQRLADLERGSGFRPMIVRTYQVEADHGRLVERVAHWMLRDSRTVGEWFHCHPLEACDAIEWLLRRGIPLGYYQAAA